jgi:hypothetical protein
MTCFLHKNKKVFDPFRIEDFLVLRIGVTAADFWQSEEAT